MNTTNTIYLNNKSGFPTEYEVIHETSQHRCLLKYNEYGIEMEEFVQPFTIVVNQQNRYFGHLLSKDAEKKAEKFVYAKRLYGYSHGLSAISTSPFNCQWDSGEIGWIGITAESFKDCNNKKRYKKCAKNTQWIEKVMQKSIDYINYVLSGQVYDVVIQKKVGDGWENVDDAHLFQSLGRDETLEEAKDIVRTLES